MGTRKTVVDLQTIGLYFDRRVKGSDASVREITSPPSASPRLTPLFIGIPFESWQNIQEWPLQVWILMDIRPLYKRSPSVQTGVALNQVRWSWETSKACKLHTTYVCTDLNQQGDVVSHSSAEMTRLVYKKYIYISKREHSFKRLRRDGEKKNLFIKIN